MNVTAGSVAAVTVLSLLWDAILAPVAATLLIVVTVIVVGTVACVLLSRREEHRHEEKWALPVARPTIDAASWSTDRR